MKRFRVATYNIHKGRGLDGRIRIDRVAEVLEEVDADLVALQEVTTFEDKSAGSDQVRYLSGRLGCYAAFGQTRTSRGRIYGNATLSKKAFVLTRPVDLTVPLRTKRNALRTDVLFADTLIHVVNVHLGLGPIERRNQARRLLGEDLLRAVDLTGPRIVLGDFNEWIKGLVTRVLSREFHSTDLHFHLPSLRGFPSGLPLLHLDHIYYDHHLRAERAFFHRSRAASMASDHLPLVADLRIRGVE